MKWLDEVFGIDTFGKWVIVAVLVAAIMLSCERCLS